MRRTAVPNVSWNANNNDRAVFDAGTVTEKVHGRTTFGRFPWSRGLAAKATEVVGVGGGGSGGSSASAAAMARHSIPVVGVLCAVVSGISYSMRGILMEYLSKSIENPPRMETR